LRYSGFGHIGFLTPRLEDACAALEGAGVAFAKRPHEGRMRGLAFARDPDGYLIEIIQHGVDM
jgi:lactoylglutathione lyase